MEGSSKLKLGLGAVLAVFVLAYVFWGGIPTGLFVGVSTTLSEPTTTLSGTPTTLPAITTFNDNGGEVETKDGKPVIRLYSTTWCSHCKWINDAYEEVVMEYVERGEIVAYHWELDIDDDTLRREKIPVPQSEKELFRKFNPRGSVPTFVFGSKYVRIGNGYERENDLEAEKAEFRAVIEELLRQTNEA